MSEQNGAPAPVVAPMVVVQNTRANIMYLAAFIIVIGLATAVTLPGIELKEYAQGIITLILGRFLGYLDNIYGYEFGATRTAQVKDTTIRNLTEQINSKPATLLAIAFTLSVLVTLIGARAS